MKKHISPLTIITIILVSFMFLSISYAGFTDNFEINGSITTNEDLHSLNLIAHWKLDECSGTTTYDSSAYQHHGFTYGAVPTCTEYIFNGETDYIEVPDDDSLDFTTNITILVWLEAVSWENPDPPYNVVQIIDKGEHETQKAFGIYAYNDNLHFRINKQTAADISAELPSLDEVHLIAATYNQYEGIIRLYVDGELKAEKNYDVEIEINNQPIYIGNGVLREYYFNGYMYDVRLYDKAFSITEIEEQYLGGIPD